MQLSLSLSSFHAINIPCSNSNFWCWSTVTNSHCRDQSLLFFCFSVLHLFCKSIFRDLFPNDLVIAISNSKPRQHHHRKWFHIRRGSSDEKEIEHYLKFSDSDVKDIESSLDPTTSSSLSNAHHNEAYASTSLAGPSHFVDLQPSHARKS